MIFGQRESNLLLYVGGNIFRYRIGYQGLKNAGYAPYIWNHILTSFEDGVPGMHRMVALILIARGLENRPIGKVINKLKKKGLADGAGIDSARNK